MHGHFCHVEACVPSQRCYGDVLTRMLWAVWRDRVALSARASDAAAGEPAKEKSPASMGSEAAADVARERRTSAVSSICDQIYAANGAEPMQGIDDLIRVHGKACHESTSATAMKEAHTELRLAITAPVKDAVRYRWMRDWLLPWSRGWRSIDSVGHIHVTTPEIIDEAIDSAIAASAEKGARP
jgi:hypothetical protein